MDWILKEKSKVQSNQFIAIAGCPSVKNEYKIFYFVLAYLEGIYLG